MGSYRSAWARAVRSVVVCSVTLLAMAGTVRPVSGEIIVSALSKVSDGVYCSAASYTLAEINAAGGILIGDKLFDSFSLTTASSYGSAVITLSGCTLTAVLVDGEYGFRINGGWSAAAGQYVDSTLVFHATILSEYVDRGFAFTGNSLNLTGYTVKNTATGSVAISENIYASHPSLGEDSIADEGVYYVSRTNKQTSDSVQFDAITEIWVVKDIYVCGGGDATGYAHISEFYQTFQQVPEPSVLAILGVGGVAFVACVRRRRQAR